MAQTKIILKKTVDNLGHPGDVVEVKAGFARNYLIPQGFAYAWSKGAEKQIETLRRARLAQAIATRADAVAVKELLEGSVVKISAKVSDSGKLFGGVSADAIAKALANKAAIDPKAVTVETIKTTGQFPVSVQLHPEITASFTVDVVGE